jgi:hypothetical protein
MVNIIKMVKFLQVITEHIEMVNIIKIVKFLQV